MKTKLRIVLATLLLAGLSSCEDDDNFMLVTPDNAEFTILTPAEGGSVILNEATPSNPGISLSWSEPDYGTPTAITYSVEVDKDMGDFTAPYAVGPTATPGQTSIIINSADLNLAALNKGATPFVESKINLRIKATVGTGAEPVYSNVISYLVTPYGCLNQYAVGAGIPASGWNWDNPTTFICNDNVLTQTVTLANETFRFFTTEGDWDSGRNYPYYTGEGYKISSTLVNAADGDSNFRFIGTPGVYRLKVDENNKTVTLAQGATTATSNWLVGAATPGGWSWAGDSETEFGLISDGVYEVPLRLSNNDTFRVFLGNDGTNDGNWGNSHNFPYYVGQGYTIDSELENANDGDSNFRYMGPTDTRVFRIDTNTKTITVE
ncbi:SusE domain-containing protein [Flavobacterium pallidum]|uniref:SusE outer membrane protein domain-containing protein n=1 Tax=Flavobacterium pallidum TaxID=2172098 RepID=A0A2S1SGA9_9FLAO|nr:SusE domain-containing protein [Flavobacterium pallidum]AWI25446.1 hypothetical protein HYN49_05775 [Flavobacterium pallidum]